MVKHVIIPKNKLSELLDDLKSSYRVIAPVLKDNLLDYREIESSKDVDLSDNVPYKSPKEFLFPQIEKFLKFHENGEISEESNLQKTVIFGVKPCDLEALKVLTAVFTQGKFVDTLYVNQLSQTILIGVGCEKEKPGCFCSQRGIDKSSSVECDIFLKDMGEYYIADIISENGERVIKDFLTGAEEVVDVNKSTDRSLHQTEVLELDADELTLFNEIDWESISETCIGCGTCTYICPTCHCFDFKDVTEKGVVNRYRCWDSCMYSKFTIHTSGHNPRPSKKERYRQRVLHKYLYIKKNFGYTACTGCGRCVRSCPAGISIKSVVKKIMEELK
jgi:sulfhydrogenase subunit beta (sulfur reductase)